MTFPQRYTRSFRLDPDPLLPMSCDFTMYPRRQRLQRYLQRDQPYPATLDICYRNVRAISAMRVRFPT
jgi:hypothetical protein